MSDLETLKKLMKSIIPHAEDDGKAYMVVECIARDQWDDAIANGKKAQVPEAKGILSAIEAGLSPEIKSGLKDAAIEIIASIDI
jgi:hypothetical protein